MSGRVLPVIPPLMRAVTAHVQASLSSDVRAPSVHIKGSRTIFSIFQFFSEVASLSPAEVVLPKTTTSTTTTMTTTNAVGRSGAGRIGGGGGGRVGVVVVIVSEPGAGIVSGFDTAAVDAIVLPQLPKLQADVSALLRLVESGR